LVFDGNAVLKSGNVVPKSGNPFPSNENDLLTNGNFLQLNVTTARTVWLASKCQERQHGKAIAELLSHRRA